MDEAEAWHNLPEHIIVQILSYLPMPTRFLASLSCKSWMSCFTSHYLWQHFVVHFFDESNSRLLQGIELYGHHVRSIDVELDQGLDVNRNNACEVIYELAKHRCLRKLRIKFRGENPYFYAGREFVNALKVLFSSQTNGPAGSKPIRNESNDTEVESNLRDNCRPENSTDTLHQAGTKRAGGNSNSAPTNKKIRTGISTEVESQHNQIEVPTSNRNNLSVVDVDETSNISNNSIYTDVVSGPREGQLREVDLSGLQVCLDDSLISLLAIHHPLLEKLNIQNRVLIVKVTPQCIHNLVQRCRKLRDMQLYMCSMSSETLETFAEENRSPLEHLSISCRREEKYGKELDEEIWQKLVKKIPSLKVTLIFDHTCPLFRITEIMKPQIPVTVLRLETFTNIDEEVRQAARYYTKTLRKLVLDTHVLRNAPALNCALVYLAEECKHLEALHVFCVLEEETIGRVLELHPKMADRKSYTLKSTPDPHPWFAGRDA